MFTLVFVNVLLFNFVVLGKTSQVSLPQTLIALQGHVYFMGKLIVEKYVEMAILRQMGLILQNHLNIRLGCTISLPEYGAIKSIDVAGMIPVPDNESTIGEIFVDCGPYNIRFQIDLNPTLRDPKSGKQNSSHSESHVDDIAKLGKLTDYLDQNEADATKYCAEEENNVGEKEDDVLEIHVHSSNDSLVNSEKYSATISLTEIETALKVEYSLSHSDKIKLIRATAQCFGVNKTSPGKQCGNRRRIPTGMYHVFCHHHVFQEDALQQYLQCKDDETAVSQLGFTVPKWWKETN